MTSVRQSENRNSWRTPAVTSAKRNSNASTLLATSVNTPSTASAIQFNKHPLLTRFLIYQHIKKSNASLEEQLKQQQLLIAKLTNRINDLASHVLHLEGKTPI